MNRNVPINSQCSILLLNVFENLSHPTFTPWIKQYVHFAGMSICKGLWFLILLNDIFYCQIPVSNNAIRRCCYSNNYFRFCAAVYRAELRPSHSGYQQAKVSIGHGYFFQALDSSLSNKNIYTTLSNIYRPIQTHKNTNRDFDKKKLDTIFDF